MFEIKNLFLFRGMKDTELADILSVLPPPVSFVRGDILYDETHFRRALGVFLSGKGSAGNDDAAKNSFTEGSVFGAAALFGAGDEYVSRITAKTACTVLFLEETTVRKLIETYPVCAVNYVTFLSDRIRYLNEKIAEYTGNGVTERLLRLLSDRADDAGCVENVNMSYFASLLGMGRTSIYRALSSLEEEGKIKKDGKTIQVRRK